MGLNKLEKFAVLDSMPNFYQNFSFHKPRIRNYKNEYPDLKGNWGKEVFMNGHPIILELACGRGEYTVGLGSMQPENNFIGIDLKGNRMFTGASHALQHGMQNIAFLRTKIELIQHFFAPDEISGIWITFADPFANHTDANRRLTSPGFLDKYRTICKNDAVIHLKTDSDILYNYSLKIVQEQKLIILENDPDIYSNGDREGPLSIKTYYERLHRSKGATIKYLAFQLQ